MRQYDEDKIKLFLSDAERDDPQLSMAVSLKRIADALDSIAGHLMEIATATRYQ